MGSFLILTTYFINAAIAEKKRNLEESSFIEDTDLVISKGDDLITPTASPWIFYPPGTRKNRVKRHYEELKLSFVGFGNAIASKVFMYQYTTTFKECLSLYLKTKEFFHKRNISINGVVYNYEMETCKFAAKDKGHKESVTSLHYRE